MAGALAALAQAVIFLPAAAGGLFIGPRTILQIPLFIAAMALLLSPAPLGLLGINGRPKLAGLCLLGEFALLVLLAASIGVYFVVRPWLTAFPWRDAA